MQRGWTNLFILCFQRLKSRKNCRKIKPVYQPMFYTYFSCFHQIFSKCSFCMQILNVYFFSAWSHTQLGIPCELSTWENSPLRVGRLSSSPILQLRTCLFCQLYAFRQEFKYVILILAFQGNTPEGRKATYMFLFLFDKTKNNFGCRPLHGDIFPAK